MNREEWLTAVTDRLRPEFEELGETVPAKIRLTCGWPSKGAFSAKQRRIGECWPDKASADGCVEVFVSPCIGDSIEAAAVLVHELIHASGHKGHRESFKRCAEAMGLTGPMRSTVASHGLEDRLNTLIQQIGPYPHAKLDKTLSPHKKDGTRMVKVVCTRPSCGYTVRTTKKWIDVGFPKCPCGSIMGLAEG